MKVIAALAAGYLIGTRTGAKDMDRLGRSLKTLCGTEEFGEVVSALRAQAGSTLREIASVIDGERSFPDAGADLVSTVRHLVNKA